MNVRMSSGSGLGSAFQCLLEGYKYGRPKCKISNQRFIKPTIPELNCPRNLWSTVARLRTGHFKGMKIPPDNSRSCPICRNCPQTQLTYF
ncbi:hypothetical protein TNCT_596261 [Trichonephila clavata]|uniref:Uncharacterized protein n=1 Tax=Trichonephila clavata TaxID=2740835 RepID=A0A8X6KV56_TRICU|nr:hypothetical protein TNCT_596261 [Trichonephila clavata]